jgi:hypothetical protein
MNGVKMRQGDVLKNLNVDETELTYKEKTMLDMLYPSVTPSSVTPSSVTPSPPTPPTVAPEFVPVHDALKDGPKVWHHFKDIILATALFVALSLPLTDTLIGKFIKIDDPNYRLAARAALFALLLFLIHNFYLSRR